MKIEIQHIPSHGTTRIFKKEAKAFATLKKLMSNGEYRFAVPITIELVVRPEHDLFKIQGHLATTVQLACSRCLESYDSYLKRRFTLRFSRKIPQDLHGRDDQGVELTADQIGLMFFKGDEIDISGAIEEQVVLALPYKPLCREDCKGLCLHCGLNLNRESCRCHNEVSPSPFRVLKKLKLPSQ